MISMDDVALEGFGHLQFLLGGQGKIVFELETNAANGLKEEAEP